VFCISIHTNILHRASRIAYLALELGFDIHTLFL
jgi:hypothetical protein